MFWKKLSEKLSKADISAFVQLSTKLSISVEDFHKLSAILGNYRQSYRYRKLQENYRKFIVIEKNDLSPTPIQGCIEIFQKIICFGKFGLLSVQDDCLKNHVPTSRPERG